MEEHGNLIFFSFSSNLRFNYAINWLDCLATQIMQTMLWLREWQSHPQRFEYFFMLFPISDLLCRMLMVGILNDVSLCV